MTPARGGRAGAIGVPGPAGAAAAQRGAAGQAKAGRAARTGVPGAQRRALGWEPRWGPRPAFRFVLALACAAAFCGIAAAQGGGWAAVEGISPGSRVEVRLSPHGTAKGTLASVSASAIDIQKSHGSIRQIARARIAKVYLAGKSHVLLGAAVGAGIGFAGGAAVEYHALTQYSDDRWGGPPMRAP